MPSHPKSKTQKHSGAGGPLKRTGPKAEYCDSVIGLSRDSIPGSQLPSVRTILQRYRALRISDPQEPTTSLAKKIASEVLLLWEKARIPTISEKNCVRKIVEKIELWRSIHNHGEVSEEMNTILASLLDLAPKLRGKASEEAQLEHLQSLMRQSRDMKRRKTEGEKYDWQVDYYFYLDQYKVQFNILHIEHYLVNICLSQCVMYALNTCN